MGSSLSTPLAADFGPCPEAVAAGCAAGWGVCSPRLSPPTSGLARRRRRRGAQLDWEFSCYGSRRRLRAWPGGGSGGVHSLTGNSLATPLAANFGPGPEAAAEGGAGSLLTTPLAANFVPGLEAAAEGCAAGRGVPSLFLSLAVAAAGFGPGLESAAEGALSWTGRLLSTPLAADFGPGPEAAAEGCAAVWGVALFASRCRLRAWPGGGSGGVAYETGCLLPVSDVMRPTVPDFRIEDRKKEAEEEGKKRNRHGKKWAYILRFPPGRLMAGPVRVAQEEHLLLLRNATAAGLLLDISTCWFVSVFSLRLSSPTSGLARRGRRCRGGARSWTEIYLFTLLSPQTSCMARRRQWRGAQLDGEFALYGVYACRRLRAWAAWPGGDVIGASSWTGSCFLCLSPPTSGLSRRRQRRGAQLDGEFAFYGSRRRLRALPGGGGGGVRSCMGSLLTTSLAADFGPGPEAAAEGSAAGPSALTGSLLTTPFAAEFGPGLGGAADGHSA